MNTPKVIIIGGGIGGLMTAIALQKKGMAAVIYEKSRSFEHLGAGLGLWANATKILDESGLLNNLLLKSSRLHELRTSTSAGKPLNHVKLKKLEERFGYPSIVLLRRDLQNELLNAISPGQLVFDKHCLRMEDKGDEITAHFSDGTSATGNVLVFADGIHSFARNDVFNLPPLKYAGRISWRGIAAFTEPVFTPGQNHEIFGKGRRIGIFPLPGNSAYWYAAVNMNRQQAAGQAATRASVQAQFSGWAEPVQQLMESTPEENIILTTINYAATITKMARGNCALLGDAAHAMTPDLGQGACQAIEDAHVLAECLGQNKTPAENLLDYERIRLPRVKSIAMNSYRTGNLRQAGTVAGVFARDTLFRFLPEGIILNMLKKHIGSSL